MNAPIAAAAVAPAAFHIVPIAAFAPSSTRTQARRRARFSKEKLAELAANLKKVGVMEPVIARPHPKPTAAVKYEIVAGERRWLAADLAGLVEIPAMVRDVPDADLVALQLSENLERETIDQLGEAEGYDELRKLKKFSADQVADLLGVSRATVFNRLKLLDLCPEASAALEKGELTPSNAMLIARIGHHDTQRRALKESKQSDYSDGPMPYRELREHIEEHYMVDLKGAPFKLDDETLLPKAGSCVKCPKRTGNQNDLFADVKNPNVCTDPKCYDDKRQLVFHRAAAELEAKGRKVIAGAAARNLMPHADNGNDHISGGYTKLTERQYGSDGRGRTAAQILGPAFKPTFLQHPGTGKLIEVASNQAIAAALSGRKPEEEKGPKAKARRAAPKLDLPDLNDQVTERLIRLIGEKAPTKFNRGVLMSLVKIVYPEINARSNHLELIAKHYGWPKTAFRSGGYVSRTKLPKETAGFDERKQAQANARMKAKLAKASPLAKTKKTAKKVKK